MTGKPDTAKLLAKANEPSKEAMRLHPFYRGKLEVTPKCRIRDFDDFAVWYTPGVAAPCMDIHANPEAVYSHTNKGNLVAVITDGTRVLGLGDIGPHAAIPVMEGKAILFKFLGGVDAFPICLDTKDPERFIETCKLLEPVFGGINLEDISHPKCFTILDRLRAEMKIPVWHDDQQGTAAVTLAGLINALQVVGKKPGKVKVAMIGAGAANIATLRLMANFGFRPENVVMCDLSGIVHRERKDFGTHFPHPAVNALLARTNSENLKTGDPETAKSLVMEGADIVIAYSKPGPGVIKPEWIKRMARDPVVFACANPVPEIWPWEAIEAGARVVATGRSDFPNQVNNSLGFPAIFRGTLDIGAKTITDEMCIAAACELASCARDQGLEPDRLLPRMSDFDVFPREAVAVALKAVEQGIARCALPAGKLLEMATSRIKRAREQTRMMMAGGFISPGD